MAGNAATLGTGRTGGRDATTGVIAGRFALAVGMPDVAPPKGWRWTALSSVAQLESGHTPSRKHPEYWDGGIPWIGIKDATENHGRTLQDTYQHVAKLGLENSSARLLPANTVCLSRTASVGFVVVMGQPMATSQDFVNWICGPNIETHFLKYVLLAENEALWRFASGTTHQTIYYPEAKAFHICLPPLAEQKAIASALGALDDKIELNRRMNETLEALAQCLFKSWFVDATQYALPKSWSVGTLSDIADIVMGLSPDGESYNTDGEGTPLINGPVEFGDYYPVKAKWTTSPTRMAQASDLIFCVRGSTTGRRVISDDAYCLGRGVCGIRARNGANTFLYQTVNFSLKNLLSKTTGSVFPSLSAPDIKGFPVVLPPPEVVARFSEKAEPLTKKIQANVRESRTLAALRDTLLPKLLSGELRVKEAYA